MKTRITFIGIFLLLLCLLPRQTYAVEDPTKLPNNKFGIHILFDHELDDAAKLVNASGGDWGYAIVPIQSGDKDLVKWQLFMDEAAKQRIIPILRLATEGDYFNTKVWRKPHEYDIVDFANFLDSLQWPTKNRYIIVFNEVNRADEWGGRVNPEEYARLLTFAVSVFKTKSQDFFMISAGMDNAAPEQYPDYMNQYNYLRKMHEAVPGIFNQVDGISSHSYPNPGFAQPPSTLTPRSIASFSYERDLIRFFRNTDVPVFITETGWNAPGISEEMKAEYYKIAFESVWNDPGIVTVAPFLLQAGGGPFTGFSFLDANGKPTPQYETLKNMQKIKGKPTISIQVLGIENKTLPGYPLRDFSRTQVRPDGNFSIVDTAQSAFQWIFKL